MLQITLNHMQSCYFVQCTSSNTQVFTPHPLILHVCLFRDYASSFIPAFLSFARLCTLFITASLLFMHQGNCLPVPIMSFLILTCSPGYAFLARPPSLQLLSHFVTVSHALTNLCTLEGAIILHVGLQSY